jgi:putative PIN family toxin of toxin-antitoxin system
VVVGFYLSRTRRSATREIFRLWRNVRHVQLIVCDEVITEYVEVLRRLQIDETLLRRFRERLAKRDTVTYVRLGARPVASRDPDDNIFLATALTGKAKFIVSSDPDLLTIPAMERQRFRFAIVSPGEFVAKMK